MLDGMLDGMLEDILDRMLEDMLNRMPDWMPDRFGSNINKYTRVGPCWKQREVYVKYVEQIPKNYPFSS